ncbi:MAG: ATP-dependent RNA helicase HrpA [Gammaproteobacteria bacterium]|nr:ATP-dependent RNA helicase HrpA [Gammaproteobacteria bacterium]
MSTTKHPTNPNTQNITTRDRYYLQRTYRQIQSRLKSGGAVDELVEKYEASIQKSTALVDYRKENLPKPTKANNLPVTARWDEIAETIKNNQVSIICGHTGSGKTTQIPQICLDIGLGARGKIAHTQPRRIAARTVAARIAEELGVELGNEVGYKVRFDEKHSKDTTVLLQTDGMLLAEIQQDRFLNNYEVIIIDEAHERSLNIDFLLGYLSQLLPKRPDLKIIITSATIDPERFAKHFSVNGEESPIVMVEGKTYPIETFYRPLVDDNDEEREADVIDGICRAIKELDDMHYGDTLIFLPTERDIRDTQEAIERMNLKHTEVLSLFSRQTAAVQNAIFKPKNKRRIVLSTNVAETSVTVPRILNVIDTGIARISRYSHRSKIQRLPIEPISRASADQRKGRCGRIAEGVCIRLYSETDFLSRPEFTDPEIKRTSLASVILQMASIGLGDIEKFPFVEPPEHKMIADGYKLLFELKAVNHTNKITKLGRSMASLPIDPRFAAVLLFAKQRAMLDRVLPIVAALVVGDIKERPFNKEQQADTAHRLFAHKQSDFLFFCNVFDAVYPLFSKSKGKAMSWAKKNYLSPMRVREWLFLVDQLAEQLKYKITMPSQIVNGSVASESVSSANQAQATKKNKKVTDLKSLSALKNSVVSPKEQRKSSQKNQQKEQQASEKTIQNEYQGIHESLLVGFLDHVGSYQPEDRDYIGARNKRFNIFPGSFLFKKKANHVVCAEIVESSRVYARQVAKIDLEWLAPLCSHLTKTIESEPMWSKKQGNVMAKQTVMLYGLPIVVGKLVPFAQADTGKNVEAAHDIFVRHGLVENDINTTVPEIAKNRGMYDKLLKLEEKSRSRDILIDENTFADLYFDVIPNSVYSEITLKAWYAKADGDAKKRLLFQERDFLLDEEYSVDSSEYPNFMNINGQRLTLTYEFDPSSERDGITATLPLASLNAFAPKDFDYLVPALLGEKITALIKSLPKRYRRQFVPAGPYVDAVMEAVASDEARDSTLIEQIVAVLKAKSSITLTDDLFDVSKLDKHYLMNIAVTDKRGKVIDESRDLIALQAQYHDRASDDFNRTTRHVFAEIFKDAFPKHIAETHKVKGKKITAYPALIEADNGFKVELFDSPEKSHSAHELGVLAFIKKGLNKEITYIKKQVLNNPKLTLAYRALTINNTDNNLIDDMVDAVLLQSYLQELPRDEKAYEAIITEAKKTLVKEAQQLTKDVIAIVTHYREARELMKPTWGYAEDVDAQLNRMVYAGFISQTPVGRLPDIARYVEGVVVRLKKANLDPQKDAKWQAQVQPFVTKLVDAIGNNKLDKSLTAETLEFAFLLEEYRLQVFAQGQVKVRGKVSEKLLGSLL